MTELSSGPLLPESCRGTAKAASSDSIVEDDDAAPLEEAADKGILGPIDDLNIGGFPGGGAPVGFRVGW